MVLDQRLDQIQRAMEQEMQSITIGDILKDTEKAMAQEAIRP